MLSKENRGLIEMLAVEKGYGAKRLAADFLRKKRPLASVIRGNACYEMLMRRDLKTAKPAVIDVALRALTRTLIASKIV